MAGIIDDITGKTGTKIIEAILEGERDPVNFLAFIDRRIKADKETIVKSLQGNWRAEHLFTLRSSYELPGFYKERIGKCDQQIEEHLQCYEARQNEGTIVPVEQKAEEKAVGVDAVQSAKKKSKESYQNNLNISSIWPGCPQTLPTYRYGTGSKEGFWTPSNFIGTSKYS